MVDCVAGDTLITTANGEERADRLLGLQFQTRVDKSLVWSSPHGFYSNGLAQVYTIFAEGRNILTATLEHPVLVLEADGRTRWVLLNDLMIGSKLALHTHARSVRNIAGRPYVICEAVEAAGTAEVYDCTIPGAHAYDAGGLYVANAWLGSMLSERVAS